MHPNASIESHTGLLDDSCDGSVYHFQSLFQVIWYMQVLQDTGKDTLTCIVS